MTDPTHVCIVGAGISGLRAAQTLLRSGQPYRVTILEARPRIGGRISQVSIPFLGSSSSSSPSLPPSFPRSPTCLVDAGASWIHGTHDNPIADLARETNTVTVPCSTVSSIIDSEGSPVPVADAAAAYDAVWDMLDQAVEASERDYAFISPDATLMDFFRRKVADAVAQGAVSQDRSELMISIVEMWGAFIGDDPERQALKGMCLERGIEGDNLLAAPTYRDILDAVARPVLDAAEEVRLDCAVSDIRCHRHGDGGGRRRVTVRAEDGFHGEFDHVVVTTPVGWLKRNHERVFSPPLPARVVSAIGSTGVGTLEKVFLLFPSPPFWDPPHTAASAAHDPGDSHPRGSFPVETLFLQPRYAGATNPRRWRQEIISYSGLSHPYARPVLMFFVHGEWGRHVTARVRDITDRTSPAYRDALDELFRPYYARLPGFAEADERCRPTAAYATDWQADALAGFGSFSNHTVGADDPVADVEAMRSGLGLGEERGLWFAGEHVAPARALGTVAGAYLSGEATARWIMEADGCGW